MTRVHHIHISPELAARIEDAAKERRVTVQEEFRRMILLCADAADREADDGFKLADHIGSVTLRNGVKFRLAAFLGRVLEALR